MHKKKGSAVRQMQDVGINMFGIRHQLGVRSIRCQIEKRVMQRIGHVLHMENTRLTKIAVIGWIKDGGIRTAKRLQTTSQYWRRVLREANIHTDTVEKEVSNREEWKRKVEERMRYIEE